MIILSQKKENITETMEFELEERKTCKNIFIDEKTWQKFRKITNKKDNYISLKELDRLGEVLEQSMKKSIYTIMQVKSNRIFGFYDTRNRAEKVIEEIAKAYNDNSRSYCMPAN